LHFRRASQAKLLCTGSMASRASSDVQTMTSLLNCNAIKWLGCVAGLTNGQKKISVADDKSYQDNVDWIRKQCGEDVEISSDLPPIHHSCGLNVGENKLLMELDEAMQAAMAKAIASVQKKQLSQAGYISWTDLTHIFESEEAEMFKPMDIKTPSTKNHHIAESGIFCKFDGTPDLANLAKAEDTMFNTVNDAKIWEMLKIDKEKIKEIFGSEGVRVNDVGDLFLRTKNVAHIAIDVGVVRFPRIEDPYFRLYRFRVIVFHSETAILFLNKAASGIFCQFDTKCYDMNQKFKDMFDEKSRKAVKRKFAEVMSFFEDK